MKEFQNKYMEKEVNLSTGDKKTIEQLNDIQLVSYVNDIITFIKNNGTKSHNPSEKENGEITLHCQKYGNIHMIYLKESEDNFLLIININGKFAYSIETQGIQQYDYSSSIIKKVSRPEIKNGEGKTMNTQQFINTFLKDFYTDIKNNAKIESVV